MPPDAGRVDFRAGPNAAKRNIWPPHVLFGLRPATNRSERTSVRHSRCIDTEHAAKPPLNFRQGPPLNRCEGARSSSTLPFV